MHDLPRPAAVPAAAPPAALATDLTADLAALARLAVLVTGAAAAAVEAAGARGTAGDPVGPPVVRLPLALPDGVPAGVLAVHAPGPLALAPAQRSALHDLARQAVALVAGARRAAEAEQAASFLRLVAEGGIDVLSRHLPDGTTLYCSPSVREVLGEEPSALLGQGSLERIHPDDREQATVAVRAALVGGDRTPQLRFRHADGSWRHLELRLSPLRDADGRVVEVHSAARDVTGRVLAEQGQRESESRYRQLVEQTPDAILVHVDGVIAFANPAAAVLLGAGTPDALLGRPVAALSDPDLAPVLRERRDQVLAGRPVPLLRQRLRRLDGTWVQAEVSGARVELDGRVGVQNVARAVHDQEAAAQALAEATRHLAEVRDEREQLRDVLDAAGDVYLVCDADGLPTQWNRAAERLFGWSREEVVAAGRRLRDIVMTDEQRAAWEPLRAAILARDPQVVGRTHELAMRHRDGRPLHVEGSWWTVQGPDGRYRLHALLRDVEPRRRQEAELEAARDAALAASSAKTAFLANMSHEIRTPLNGVLGMTALLRDSDLAPQQREWADLAHRSGQGLLAVVDDILDLAKIEAGRLDVVHRLFDLRSLLADACAPLSAAAAAKGLDLRLSVADDLPRTVSGDPDRLRQVLVNLLGNAVKFTSSGTVALSAEAHPGSAVWFAVSDTGPGIAEEDQDRLFEPFTQADASTTRRFGGTGLGLAISRDLVQVLGGELLVSSAEGRGSTFSFSLPLTDVARPVAAAAPVPVPAAPPVRGLRLLLAEDSLVNQLVAVEMLTREGCEVDVVEDGRQVLDRLATDPGYDALLLDCQMPVLDGYDTARELRRREAEHGGRRLPVLALTAAAFVEDRDRCLQAGMDDYLSKPFVPADVLSALQRLTA